MYSLVLGYVGQCRKLPTRSVGGELALAEPVARGGIVLENRDPIRSLHNTGPHVVVIRDCHTRRVNLFR